MGRTGRTQRELEGGFALLIIPDSREIKASTVSSGLHLHELCVSFEIKRAYIRWKLVLNLYTTFLREREGADATMKEARIVAIEITGAKI